jgi:hypothetical protein
VNCWCGTIRPGVMSTRKIIRKGSPPALASPTSWGHGFGEKVNGPTQEGSIAMAEYQAKLLWTRYQAMLAAARKKKTKEPPAEKKEKTDGVQR